MTLTELQVMKSREIVTKVIAKLISCFLGMAPFRSCVGGEYVPGAGGEYDCECDVLDEYVLAQVGPTLSDRGRPLFTESKLSARCGDPDCGLSPPFPLVAVDPSIV